MPYAQLTQRKLVAHPPLALPRTGTKLLKRAGYKPRCPANAHLRSSELLGLADLRGKNDYQKSAGIGSSD
jgi:hypothetical protein